MKNYKLIEKKINKIYKQTREEYNTEVDILKEAERRVRRYIKNNKFNEDDLLKLHNCYANVYPAVDNNIISIVMSVFGALLTDYIIEEEVFGNFSILLSILIILFTIGVIIFFNKKICESVFKPSATYFNTMVAELIWNYLGVDKPLKVKVVRKKSNVSNNKIRNR